jgi:hypothetical protein
MAPAYELTRRFLPNPSQCVNKFARRSGILQKSALDLGPHYIPSRNLREPFQSPLAARASTSRIHRFY